MKKRILITYARYGSGHKSIAEYVAKYIKEHNKHEILILDLTDYTNDFGNVSIKFMDWISKKRIEVLFDVCYEITDRKISNFGYNRFVKKSFDNEKLRKIISDFNPDITISSHFFCSSIIAYYNELKLINSKIFTIITDYKTHEYWNINHKKEDGFIVGNEMVKNGLIKRGVDSRKIYPFGLPLNNNEISKLDDDKVILKRYKLSNKKQTYLFFGGSTAGSMYYFNYFKTLVKMNLDVNIIFISGNNIKLQKKCQEYTEKRNIKNVIVLGYTNDVFNLMKISDLVISKPGGATVTECLEMKVPMLLVPGVGGQEKYNNKFMSKNKYAIKARGTYSFKRRLKQINSNPQIILNMKKRLLKMGDNKSVEKINNLINKIK